MGNEAKRGDAEVGERGGEEEILAEGGGRDSPLRAR